MCICSGVCVLADLYVLFCVCASSVSVLSFIFLPSYLFFFVSCSNHEDFLSKTKNHTFYIL